jgi:hypothetical protein
MRYLILDVETLPDPTVLPLLDAVKPAGNLKDPAKIAQDIADKTAARADKMALSPDYCQIAVLGYHVVGGGDPITEACQCGADEINALTQFWRVYGGPVNEVYGASTALITFNGFRFDLPVLMRRSQLLGVPCPTLELTPWKTPHIDVYDKLTFGGKIDGHSLKFYCRRFGIPIVDDVDGKDVGKLWAEGNYEAVKQHCLADIGSTHALANRLGLLRLT